MRPLIRKMLVRKAALAVAIPVALAAMAGGSYAVASFGTDHHSANVANHSQNLASDNTPRFHGDATTACPFPDGSTLTGNWTHGQYVAAWASTKNAAAVRSAAASSCGMPLSATQSHAPKSNDSLTGTVPTGTPTDDVGEDQGGTEPSDVNESPDPTEVEHGDGQNDNEDNGSQNDNNGGSGSHDGGHSGGGDHGGGDHGGDSGGDSGGGSGD